MEHLTAQLEDLRRTEIDAEVADIKKRIIAFSIRPEEIFSHDDLQPCRKRSGNKQPAKYKDRKSNANMERHHREASLLRRDACARRQPEAMLIPGATPSSLRAARSRSANGR